MSKLIPWFGGKSRLVKSILACVPPHRVYCEPFAGSASVLLGKAPSDYEVLNDLNGELVNLFRVVQCHPDEFVRHIRWTLCAS